MMKDETQLAQAGRAVSRDIETVNPALHRASTVLFPTMAALEDATRPYVYGRRGTPTTRALEDALSALEGGERTVLYPSGLAAITGALLAFADAGSHVLITDACYQPTRRFADKVLKRLGVDVSYFDPNVAAAIESLLRPTTTVILCESPGSHSFEVQDLPAIAAVARAHDITVMVDNTWASPLFHKPLSLGAQISIQSATKYIAGHSDLLLGSVTASADAARRLVEAHGLMGACAGPEEAYTTLRGLRTLSVRMNRHQENGLAVARWLAARPEVARVLHPALPDAPGHSLWRRDFSGASGTFGVTLKPVAKTAVAALVDGLKLFGIGYSFGGFESLIVPSEHAAPRTASPPLAQPTLRLHIGLEDPADLIADLEAGFERLNLAARP